MKECAASSLSWLLLVSVRVLSPLISRAKRLSVSLQLQVKVMIDLENNDILEICATVIAGALIFLTLSSSSISREDVLDLILTQIFGLGVIIYFSYAALKAISGKKDRAIKHMRNGFLFIIVMGFIFLIGNVISFYDTAEDEFTMINQSNMTMNK